MVLFLLQFNNLFKLPEKHSSWSGNNEIFCEDSNSGLLDHNLQLLDSEILQSPTKLGLFSEVIGIVEHFLFFAFLSMLIKLYRIQSLIFRH